MSAQTDQVFSRVNKWVYNHGRQASPFYIVVMIVTTLMLAFADPTAGIISACVGLIIVGWRDIDNVSRGSPADLFFHTFNEDSVEQTCKYYEQAMRNKGIPEDVAQLDNAILRFYHQQRDLSWTYFMLTMMQRRATMEISLREPNEPESVQQTELPPVPASESAAGVEGDTVRNPDPGN